MKLVLFKTNKICIDPNGQRLQIMYILEVEGTGSKPMEGGVPPQKKKHGYWHHKYLIKLPLILHCLHMLQYIDLKKSQNLLNFVSKSDLPIDLMCLNKHFRSMGKSLHRYYILCPFPYAHIPVTWNHCYTTSGFIYIYTYMYVYDYGLLYVTEAEIFHRILPYK